MATPKSFEGLGALIEQEIAHMPPNHTHHAVHPGNRALQSAQSAAQQALTKDWRRVDAITHEPGAVMCLPQPAQPIPGWAVLTDHPRMKFDPTTGEISPFKGPPTYVGWHGPCGHTWNVLNIDWSQRKPPECPTCALWDRAFAPPGASLYGTQPGDESEAEAIDAAMGDALSTGTGFIQAGRDGTHHVPSVWRLPSLGELGQGAAAILEKQRDHARIEAREAQIALGNAQARAEAFRLGCVSAAAVEDGIVTKEEIAGWVYEECRNAYYRPGVVAAEQGNHDWKGPTRDVLDKDGEPTGRREAVSDPVAEQVHRVVGDVLAGKVLPAQREQLGDALGRAPKHQKSDTASTDAPMPGKALKLTHADVGLKLP